MNLSKLPYGARIVNVTNEPGLNRPYTDYESGPTWSLAYGEPDVMPSGYYLVRDQTYEDKWPGRWVRVAEVPIEGKGTAFYWFRDEDPVFIGELLVGSNADKIITIVHTKAVSRDSLPDSYRDYLSVIVWIVNECLKAGMR